LPKINRPAAKSQNDRLAKARRSGGGQNNEEVTFLAGLPPPVGSSFGAASEARPSGEAVSDTEET
jgi:hypothetical protein